MLGSSNSFSFGILIPFSDESEETVLQENGPKWQNWLNLERFREKHHWLPWKPNELEDECEDPDRMVLFDDVSASLFRIKEEESKFLLLIRFLAILGVQVEPHFESLCRFLGCHDPNFVTDSQEILDDTRHFQWKFYSSDRSSRMFSLEPLFDPTTKYYEFVAQVFQQSVSLLKGVQKQLLIHLWIRHLCHLAGQSRNTNLYKVQLKETKKVIKNFLKLDENRNNLSLWTEYATLEWQCKNYDESRKIFDLALTTYFQTYGQWSKMTHEQRTSLCNVFKVYTELELGIKLDMSSTNSESKDTKVRALSILLHLGSDEKYVPYSKSCGEISPALILKAKFQYKTVHEMLLRVFDNEELTGDKYQLQDSLEGMQQNLLIDWTVCYGLFEYLTDGLRAASDIFENTLQHLTIFSENIANNEAGTSTELR